ncbi:MAG: lysophospholipase L1-like esterase, partial [Myxococcota bacterium]
TITQNALSGSRYGKGRYGYGGVAGLGWGAKSSYRVYAKRMELYYLEYPKGGNLEVTIDGGEPIPFSTRGEKEIDRYKVFEAEGKGEHTFVVRSRGGGNVHAYGVTLENDGPGVVYDCIGLIGTRASRVLNFDEAHLTAQVKHRNPNLQIIMFGGNELVDKRMNLSVYEKKYAEVIARLRAGAPNASCMMMTPVDHGERHRGRVRTVPLLKKMIPIQQRIAEQAGCAFFNTFEAMGGEGSIGRWYDAKPRLAWGDFAHLTRAGDRVLGAMVYKALMKGFADWLEAKKTEETP